MKEQEIDELIDYIQFFLRDIIQDDAENVNLIIICLLNGKTTDNGIEEETGLRLNIVRRILYKLYDEGIATYKRSKDPETQWFTYEWKFELKRVNEVLTNKNQEVIDQLEKTIEEYETNTFFICPKDNELYTFEDATNRNFKCDYCNTTLELFDMKQTIKDIKKSLQTHKQLEFNFK